MRQRRCAVSGAEPQLLQQGKLTACAPCMHAPSVSPGYHLLPLAMDLGACWCWPGRQATLAHGRNGSASLGRPRIPSSFAALSVVGVLLGCCSTKMTMGMEPLGHFWGEGSTLRARRDADCSGRTPPPQTWTFASLSAAPAHAVHGPASSACCPARQPGPRLHFPNP